MLRGNKRLVPSSPVATARCRPCSLLSRRCLLFLLLRQEEMCQRGEARHSGCGRRARARAGRGRGGRVRLRPRLDVHHLIDEWLEREQHGAIVVNAEVGLDVTNDGTLALERRAEEHALTHEKQTGTSARRRDERRRNEQCHRQAHSQAVIEAATAPPSARAWQRKAQGARRRSGGD